MAAAHMRAAHATWPIAYGHRTRTAPERGTGVAWGLFLGLGLPFLLMAVLTVLARAGTYVVLFRPLWQPWPPDVLKPFVGLAVFAATLADLAYRTGIRSGYRAGIATAASRTRAETLPLPPPPPPDDAPEESE